MKSYCFIRRSSFALLFAFFITASGCGGDGQDRPELNPAAGESLPADTATSPTPVPETTAPAPQTPETVLVTVDDKSITRADLNREMDKMKTMMQKSGLSPEQMDMILPNMENQFIDGLVIRALLENECEREKVVVSIDEVKAELEQIKSELPEHLSFDELLAQSGMSLSALEGEIEQQLKLKKLLDIPEPTDEQIKAYYEENKDYFEMPETISARHILIMVEDADTEEERKKKKERAEEIRAKLNEGADFAELAEASSDCPSKRQGGELGNVRRGQMVMPFEEAVFNLNTGEISEVVETQFGYHVIQALEHTKGKTLTLDEVAPRIKAELQSEGFREKAGSLIERLREKADITYSEGVERVEHEEM